MNKTQQIASLIEETKEDSYKEGLAAGYNVARRIFLLYYGNDQLRVPHSKEKLASFVQKDLDELLRRMK